MQEPIDYTPSLAGDLWPLFSNELSDADKLALRRTNRFWRDIMDRDYEMALNIILRGNWGSHRRIYGKKDQPDRGVVKHILKADKVGLLEQALRRRKPMDEHKVKKWLKICCDAHSLECAKYILRNNNLEHYHWRTGGDLFAIGDPEITRLTIVKMNYWAYNSGRVTLLSLYKNDLDLFKFACEKGLIVPCLIPAIADFADCDNNKHIQYLYKTGMLRPIINHPTFDPNAFIHSSYGEIFHELMPDNIHINMLRQLLRDAHYRFRNKTNSHRARADMIITYLRARINADK